MIFTSTYIQMMKESPIQKEKKYLNCGNWYAVPSGSGFPPIVRLCIKDKSWKSSSTIWLLTSDDWWERIEKIDPVMLAKDEFSFYRLVSTDEWYLRITPILGDVEHYTSKSTLELLPAFYHHERWGMRWSGKKWIR